MAIDSAAKRRSTASVGQVFLGPGVTPNASKDVAWRQQVTWNYSGIEVTDGEEAGLRHNIRRRRWAISPGKRISRL